MGYRRWGGGTKKLVIFQSFPESSGIIPAIVKGFWIKPCKPSAIMSFAWLSRL